MTIQPPVFSPRGQCPSRVFTKGQRSLNLMRVLAWVFSKIITHPPAIVRPERPRGMAQRIAEFMKSGKIPNNGLALFAWSIAASCEADVAEKPCKSFGLERLKSSQA
jgi:hypothetical protein